MASRQSVCCMELETRQGQHRLARLGCEDLRARPCERIELIGGRRDGTEGHTYSMAEEESHEPLAGSARVAGGSDTLVRYGNVELEFEGAVDTRRVRDLFEGD